MKKKWSTPSQILFQLVLIIIILFLFRLYTGDVKF